jgi:hypothetical protein
MYQHCWWRIADWRRLYNLSMIMWRVFDFLGIWVPKAGADVVDVSYQCSLTRSCCVVPCDVNAREFGTCPISGDGVVFAERREEIFSLDLFHVFDTKIIHN